MPTVAGIRFYKRKESHYIFEGTLITQLERYLRSRYSGKSRSLLNFAIYGVLECLKCVAKKPLRNFKKIVNLLESHRRPQA